MHASSLCKITITHVLVGTLPDKIPLVSLPFKGFPPMTKQVTNSFLYEALHLQYQGCYYSDYSKNPERLNHSIRIRAMTHARSSWAIRHQNGNRNQNEI